MMNFAQIGIINSLVGVAIDADYQAILDRATVLGYSLPSAGQQAKQNQLVISLKSAGIWSSLDILYVFATDGDSDFAKLNWKTPASFLITSTALPTFSSNQGFTGNGTTQFLNTNWVASTHGVNYTQNSAGIFIGSNTDLTANTDADFGAAGATLANRTTFFARQVTTARFYINSSTATITGSNPSTIGNYLIQRRASNDIRMFADGVSFATDTTASTGVPAAAMYICGENQNGSLSNASARQITHFATGAACSSLESTFNTIWNNYFTSL